MKTHDRNEMVEYLGLEDVLNAFTWQYENVNGFEMWTSSPEGGPQYLVIHDGTGEYTAYFSIGTAHKFTRPIDGAFLDLDAAQAACFNHHSKPA